MNTVPLRVREERVPARGDHHHDPDEDEQDPDRQPVGEVDDVRGREQPQGSRGEQDEAEPGPAAHRLERTSTAAPTAISAIGQTYLQARKSDQISSARKKAPRTTNAIPIATAPVVRSPAARS